MKLLPTALGTALILSLMSSSLPAADTPLVNIPLKTITGEDTSLQKYAGKVLLVVNVASQCGYTRQYTGLEALHQKYQARGFSVLGFPCNDFGGQEPGTEQEIQQFCSSKYSVTFPLFSKLHTKGPDQHPLYAALTGPQSPVPGPVKWNFGKFLLGKDGKILARFDSKVEPLSEELIAAVEAALAAK